MSTTTDAAQADLRVFLSYRRSDCQAQANGLHDGLVHRLPRASVFMDIDSIPYGVDFEQHIRDEIKSCDVVLVLIGDDWLSTTDGKGNRRLNDPEDFVRLEIESALSTPTVRVVPVLVEGAGMPRIADLPRSIQRLARLNAIELNDRRWKADLRTLANVVEELGQAPLPSRASASEDEATTSSSLRLNDVAGEAVRQAVHRMPSTFQSKDVSQDEEVARAHGSAAEARNYHSMVGSHLSRHAQQYGIRSAGESSNGRGERWERVASSVPPPRPVTPPVAPPAATGSPTPPQRLVASSLELPRHTPFAPPPPRPPASSGAQTIRFLMVVLPFLTFSLASWAPALWASFKRDDDAVLQRRLKVIAILLAGLTLMGWVLFISAPVDADDTPVGPRADIGLGLVLLLIVGGTTVACLQRNAGIDAERRRAQALQSAPWMQEAVAGREARAHHRALAAQDPRLAQANNVGRPDLPRGFDDGGLLDMNSLPGEALVAHAGLGRVEAEAVVNARQRYGRLSSVDELVVHAGVDTASAERLREYAVFL